MRRNSRRSLSGPDSTAPPAAAHHFFLSPLPPFPIIEPPWLLFSASKLVLAQLLAFAGYHLHKAIEEANTESSYKRLKKRTLYGLIGAFEVAALSNFLSDIIFFARTSNVAAAGGQPRHGRAPAVLGGHGIAHVVPAALVSTPSVAWPWLRWRVWEPAQRLVHGGAPHSPLSDALASHLGAAVLVTARCAAHHAARGTAMGWLRARVFPHTLLIFFLTCCSFLFFSLSEPPGFSSVEHDEPLRRPGGQHERRVPAAAPL